MILIASLRFSGTHFAQRALSPHRAPSKVDDDKYPVTHCHIDEYRWPIIEITKRKIVVPARPLNKIAASWKARAYGPDMLDVCLDLTRKITAHYLDIESPDFDALEDFVGFPVCRETSVIRGTDLRPPAKNVDEYMSIITKHNEWWPVCH